MNENNEIINEQEGKEEVIRDEYMDFVERMTLLEGNFDTRTLGYLPCIGSDDKHRLNKFGSLYDRIDDYARSNGFGPHEAWGYNSYGVKYNNTGYTIVRSYSENVHYCFKSRKDDSLDNFIDFNDIIKYEEKCRETYDKKHIKTLFYE